MIQMADNFWKYLSLSQKKKETWLWTEEIKLTDENNKSKKWGVDRNGLQETKVWNQKSGILTKIRLYELCSYTLILKLHS